MPPRPFFILEFRKVVVVYSRNELERDKAFWQRSFYVINPHVLLYRPPVPLLPDTTPRSSRTFIIDLRGLRVFRSGEKKLQRRFAGRPPIRPKRASFPRPVTKRSPIDRWVMRLLKLSLHTRARAPAVDDTPYQDGTQDRNTAPVILAFQPFNRVFTKMGNEQTVPNEREREREIWRRKRRGVFLVTQTPSRKLFSILGARIAWPFHKSRRDNNRVAECINTS